MFQQSVRLQVRLGGPLGPTLSHAAVGSQGGPRLVCGFARANLGSRPRAVSGSLWQGCVAASVQPPSISYRTGRAIPGSSPQQPTWELRLGVPNGQVPVHSA